MCILSDSSLIDDDFKMARQTKTVFFLAHPVLENFGQ